LKGYFKKLEDMRIETKKKKERGKKKPSTPN
jgi:hypothetical protein